MNIKRNGDWSFIPFNGEMPAESKNEKDFVFAEGEATNHFHIAHVSSPEKMKYTKMSDGSYLVEFFEEATITHPEHSEKVDLKIAPGKYKLVQKREMDWFQNVARKIID